MKSFVLRPSSVVSRLQELEAKIDTVLFAKPDDETDAGSRNRRVLVAGAVGAGAAGSHVLINGQGGYAKVGSAVRDAVANQGKILARNYKAGTEIGGLSSAESALRATAKRLKSLGRKALTTVR